MSERTNFTIGRSGVKQEEVQYMYFFHEELGGFSLTINRKPEHCTYCHKKIEKRGRKWADVEGIYPASKPYMMFDCEFGEHYPDENGGLEMLISVDDPKFNTAIITCLTPDGSTTQMPDTWIGKHKETDSPERCACGAFGPREEHLKQVRKERYAK